MYVMWIVILSLSVTDLVVSSGTGWASWEHHAACSIRCVSGYETETKRCCETGDNRFCYSLAWDTLKMYIGTCPNNTTTLGQTPAKSTTTPLTQSTTVSATTPSPFTPSTETTKVISTTTKSTTATKHFSTTVKSLTRSTRLTTTSQMAKTIPPVTTTCAVCAGPKFLCEQLYAPSPCSPPNNYCINTITNHRDGTREVNRACGNFDTCYRDWFQGSFDIDLCRYFDENNELRLEFNCTYCCIKDNCNMPLRPSYSTLYIP